MKRVKQTIGKRLLKKAKSNEAFEDFTIINGKTRPIKKLLMDGDEAMNKLNRIIERRKLELKKGYL